MSASPKPTDDPSATYRGYRRQAIYCLSRVLDDTLPAGSVVQPEGSEDLAIYDASGDLAESVQVKDYSSKLAASNFKPVYYHRVAKRCVDDPDAAIKIVSFGDVGPDLAAAYDDQKQTPEQAFKTVKDRLERGDRAKLGLLTGWTVEDEAKEIFTRTTIEQVREESLIRSILDRLTSLSTAGDPEAALEVLLWWIVAAAEAAQKLTRDSVIEKINAVGTFLSQRGTFDAEWGVSIRPIAGEPIEETRKEGLANEFFRGGRVTTAHISAGVDVRRDASLHRVHSAFEKSSVVIVRAASGQGKTTLAYRYLLDWTPEMFRYEAARPEGLSHARAMATAVEAHCAALKIPLVVYVDVRPGDTNWVEFVRTLSGVDGLRVLVTIREEDWFRSRVTSDQFVATEVTLDFEESEASELFVELAQRTTNSRVFDFEDAWARLGGRKTLFEFAFLVTQDERLVERVRAQASQLQERVNANELRPEELNFLRAIVCAGAFDARVDLTRLLSIPEMKTPEPAYTLKRFSDEYLIRQTDDGRLVTGFHPIRSELLAAELTDDVLKPRSQIEAVLAQTVVDEDLEGFLLYAFSRSNDAEPIVAGLRERPSKSITAIRAGLGGLQWLGLRDYIAANRRLVDKAYAEHGSGWWMLLDWDLAGLLPPGEMSPFARLAASKASFGTSADKAAAKAKRLQSQQTDKSDVHRLAVEWLKDAKVGLPSEMDAGQLIGLGDILFWAGHLGCADALPAEWTAQEVITSAWRALSIDLFSRFALGFRQVDADVYQLWLDTYQSEVESRYMRQTETVCLEAKEGCLVSHFLIRADRSASVVGERPSSERESTNDLAVGRVEVACGIFPGHDRYGTNAYGHQTTLIPSHDDSGKRMPVRNIPPVWLPQFNGVARGLANYAFRVEDWQTYFAEFRNVRSEMTDAIKAIAANARKSGRPETAADFDLAPFTKGQETLGQSRAIPKSAVDKWGFISEETLPSGDPSVEIPKYAAFERIRPFLLERIRPFLKARSQYESALSNMLKQAPTAWLLVPHLRAAVSEEAREAMKEVAKSQGANPDFIRLSVANGFDAYRALLNLQCVEAELPDSVRPSFESSFLTEERRVLEDAVVSLSTLCFPDQIPKPKASQKSKRLRRKSSASLPSLLTATRNRLKSELARLKGDGFAATIHNESLMWDGEPALWITLDSPSVMESLAAAERLWDALVAAFRPDQGKIVRVKAIETFWSKIVCVPLVRGRSVSREAYPNLGSTVLPLNQDGRPEMWHLWPGPIDERVWDRLGLTEWPPLLAIETAEPAFANYFSLFSMVDRLADLARLDCSQNKVGEQVLNAFVNEEFGSLEKRLEETTVELTRLVDAVSVAVSQTDGPNADIETCLECLIAVRDRLLPVGERLQTDHFSIGQIVNWRNSLSEGFPFLGVFRAAWTDLALRNVE